jgi:hypothetical protein
MSESAGTVSALVASLHVELVWVGALSDGPRTLAALDACGSNHAGPAGEAHMGMKHVLAVGLLGVGLPALGAGCDGQEPESDDEDDLGIVQQGVCFTNNPPDYDSTADFDYPASWSSPSIGGYGSGECDAWTFQITDHEQPVGGSNCSANPIHVGPTNTVSQADCEDIEVTYRAWYKTSPFGSWTAMGEETAEGEWVDLELGTDYCGFDIPAIYVPSATQIRVWARVRDEDVDNNRQVSLGVACNPN